MQVILLEDVDKLGKTGELHKVKPGFARNFLMPRGLAVFADPVTLEIFERKREKLEAEAEERRVQAEANKEALENAATITVQSKAGVSGKLYGSITKTMIADAIKAQLKMDVDRHKIKADANINAIGEYPIKVGLGSGLDSDLIVKVEPIE